MKIHDTNNYKIVIKTLTIMLKSGTLFFLTILLFALNYKILQAQETNNSTFTVKTQEQKEIKGQTYRITDNGSVTDVQPYIDALNSSEMKNHRLLNKRSIINFRTGLKVELFSASEIYKIGRSINLTEYPESFDATHQEPVFVLGANNFIIEYHTALSKHH